MFKEKLTEATLGLTKVKYYRHKGLLMSQIAPLAAIYGKRIKQMETRWRRNCLRR